MKNQITDSLLMIRPVNFRLNEETAINNYFQTPTKENASTILKKAQNEFDEFVLKLKNVGAKVSVFEDKKERDTPDSIFPNNWVSFHENGKIILYPMFAKNRRKERRMDIIEGLKKEGYRVSEIIDYSYKEEDNLFLEGTGSLILDRPNKKAYCSLSPRANIALVKQFCKKLDYRPIVFNAYQTVENSRKKIYHTNVMMGIAENFSLLCLDCIDNKKERKKVVDSLQENKKEIIELSEEQISHFSGNILQIQGSSSKHLVMSQTARNSLTLYQIKKIKSHCEILSAELSTIEGLGGGSARCMIAEVFLPKEKQVAK